jgi:hypothetical protein
VARPERFELPTPWFVARYSIQLSYGREGVIIHRKISLGMSAFGEKRSLREVISQKVVAGKFG